MRGRPPKPTHLHVIDGTMHTTRHRARKLEPQPQGELGPPPDWFTPEQRQIWMEALDAAPMGLLKTLDRSVFEVWVVARAEYERAARVASVANQLQLTPNGMLIQGPLLGIMNRQAALMLKAAAELGFSPASRSRVQVQDPQRDDPAEAYFSAPRRS